MSLHDTLKPVAEAIKTGKKVTFFHGAGVSTAAGIPDFRSPKTGLYANLAKLDLPYAEAIFDIDYFRENPKPFYTLADELYPGKFNPTAFHYMVRLFQDKNLLKRVYTQNIDTLERIAGIKDQHIVEAHGSFATNHCIDCHKDMAVLEVKEQMSTGIPTCPDCKGTVKPDIVFFGEGLPPRFFNTWDEDCDEVELAIVAGTSLSVYPFASLPTEIDRKCMRVLVNKELVGDFKSNERKNDVVLLYDCNTVAETLCELLGWKEDLENLKKHGRVELGADLEQEIENFSNKMKHLLDEEKAEKKASENTPNGTPAQQKDIQNNGKEQEDLSEKYSTETNVQDAEQKPGIRDTRSETESPLSRLVEKITGLKI